jgi:hypothetical protein
MLLWWKEFTDEEAEESLVDGAPFSSRSDSAERD